MRPTRALIHRDHLLENLQSVRDCVPPGTAVCAAVKADAYGHGAVAVARLLADAGTEGFAVATVDEGRQLRSAGITQPILMLGSLQPDELGPAVEADLDLLVWTEEAVALVAEAARGRKMPLRVHLKVDTGMGRVGCRPDEAEGVASAIVHALPLELAGICTHLASSDGPGPLTVDIQLKRFGQAVDALKTRGWNPGFVHAANSGGILSWPGTHFNLVRPGIVLYGYGPQAPGVTLKPVMELVSKVGYVKTVPEGTTLSYGSRYVTNQTTDVATIPLGYADGYRRGFTNKAPVVIGGRRYQVSGTVCMDQFLVDLGPDSGVNAGDDVVLFGPQGPTAADLADLAGTISYEILCGIAARVPRIVV